jgi:hypothetical protein
LKRIGSKPNCPKNHSRGRKETPVSNFAGKLPVNYDIGRKSISMPDLLHLYISPAHNYFGHHGQPPGDAPMVESDHLECVAGHGIRNDRFFDFKDDYKGQITFFSREVYDDLCNILHIHDKPPSVFRRNVIISGIDLATWFNSQFELQGIQFQGRGECTPCYWMDHAFGPGAEEALQGRGGLRAVILTDGMLRKTPAP